MLPREKLKKRGIATLTDTDLVSVLIGSGSKFKDVFKLAREVANLLSERLSEFVEGEERNEDWGKTVDYLNISQISGIGEVKSMQIICALELGRRIFGSDKRKKSVIKSSKDVIEHMSYLKKYKQEHVVALLLDARNRLIDKFTVAVGSLNKVVVEPRDIFYRAVRKNGAKIIIVHNHPSRNTSPSKADIKFGQKLQKAGDIIGIQVLDQVII
jgi:DNA repair protein RadC